MSDLRSKTIRLASSMSKGSSVRRDLLAVLDVEAASKRMEQDAEKMREKAKKLKTVSYNDALGSPAGINFKKLIKKFHAANRSLFPKSRSFSPLAPGPDSKRVEKQWKSFAKQEAKELEDKADQLLSGESK